MKKTLGFIGAALLMAAPAMAADTTTYNCDFQPSCEVAPGIYGAMASPVKSKFDLSIGGFVKLDYAYNSVNLGANGFLLPGAPGGGIPAVGSQLANQDQSQLSARFSRFWFKVAGPSFIGAKTGALIEADFLGTGNTTNEIGTVRMRHAYGTMDWTNTQVLFGQSQDIFAPAAPSTVDSRLGATFGTPANPRVAQLRVTQKVPLGADNSLKLVFGVQNPIQDNTTASATVGASGTVVDAAGQVMFISKALGAAPGFYGMAMNNLTVGAFGLYGSQKVLGNDRAVDVYGYGVYGFVPILKSSDGKNRAMTASLETQAYISAGMNWNGSNASNPLTFSAIAAPTGTDSTVGAAGHKTAAKGYGLYGQVIFYPTQDLGLTAGYQRRNALSYATYGAANFEKFNELIYTNVAYDLNAAVRVAAEYEHVKTQYAAAPTVAGAGTSDFGQANVLRLAAYYFF